MTVANSPRRPIPATRIRRLETCVSIAVLASIVVATLPVLQPQAACDALAEWVSSWRAPQVALPPDTRPRELRLESIAAHLEPSDAVSVAEPAVNERPSRERTQIVLRIEKDRVLGFYEIKYIEVDPSMNNIDVDIQEVLSRLMGWFQPLTADG